MMSNGRLRNTDSLLGISFDIMWEEEVQVRISIGMDGKVHREILNDKYKFFISTCIFKNTIEISDIREFILSRLPPSGSPNMEYLLSELGLASEDIVEIAKRTLLVMYNDMVWLRFSGSNIKFNDIRVR